MARSAPFSRRTPESCGGDRDNSTTPQLPTPNERPSSNAQDSQVKKARSEVGFSGLDVGFLPWAFWEFRVGRYLGIGSCGVVELTAKSPSPGIVTASDISHWRSE